MYESTYIIGCSHAVSAAAAIKAHVHGTHIVMVALLAGARPHGCLVIFFIIHEHRHLILHEFLERLHNWLVANFLADIFRIDCLRTQGAGFKVQRRFLKCDADGTDTHSDRHPSLRSSELVACMQTPVNL